MGIRLINARSLDYTGTSSKFTVGFEAGKRYALTADTDCWYEWDVEGGAVVAGEDGAIQLLAGQIREDSPKNGAYLHVIRSAVSGKLNVAEIEEDAAPTVNVEVVNDEPIRVRETKAY